MALFALRRLVLAVPLLIGITFISFLVIQLAPGGPFDYLRTDSTSQDPKLIEQLNREYGLDQPTHVQYWRWLTRIALLDFGRSFQPDNKPVLTKIGERLPITLFLNLAEMLIIVSLAIPIGVASATRQYSLFDKVTTVFVFSGLAGLSRYMRQSMLEVIRQDYVQTARAKGLPEPVVIGKHALRNAVLPVVTILGLSLPGLIGGSVIIESIFAIPGMGQLMVQSVFSRD